MAGSLVVLTGASGSGKTTLARAVQQSRTECEVLFFDSVGVPSAEVMATFGSGHQPGGAWQRAMTMQWIERIATTLRSGRRVVFEGQMRIAFIQEALAAQEICDARVILVDCPDAIRKARLVDDRKSPHLAGKDMLSWAAYLRQEAVSAGCEILDTGITLIEEAVQRITSYLS